MIKKILLLTVAFVSIQAQAQKMWRLDPSFNGNGRLNTAAKKYSMQVGKSAYQSDGKILIAGNYKSEFADNPHMSVARFFPNGDLDVNFGKPWGIAIYSVENYANCITVQKDDKILVGYKNEVIRFTKDGILDATFDGDGALQIAFAPLSISFINRILVQPDGKIIVGGFVGTPQYWLMMVRLNANGSLDSSFGINGYVYTKNGTKAEQVEDMVLTADGKILVATTNTYDAMVLKYKSNGDLDSTFGLYGRAKAKMCPYEENFMALDLQKDGKIVAGGWVLKYTGALKDKDMAFTRFTSDGFVDSSFGNKGYVTLDIKGDDDWITDVLVDSNDGIWITGYAHTGLYRDMFAAKYDKSGGLDTVNLENGIFLLNMLGSVPRDDVSRDISFDSKGRILITGSTVVDEPNDKNAAALVCLHYTNDTIQAGVNFTIMKQNKVYPVPFNDKFYISGFDKNEGLPTILDLNGRLLNPPIKMDGENIIVDMCQYPNGLYFLMTANNSVISKLVKIE